MPAICLFFLTVKGPLTCKCLMTLLMCMSLYITNSLPARFKCVSINYNNFSCIFLRSGNLLKSTRSSFASCDVTEGKNKHNNRQCYAPRHNYMQLLIIASQHSHNTTSQPFFFNFSYIAITIQFEGL